MSLEILSNILLFGFVGVVGVVAIMLLGLLATSASGGRMTFRLPSFTGISKNTLIAVSLIAVGALLIWTFWDAIVAFPSMSLFGQILVSASAVFICMASYGLYEHLKAGDSKWPKRFTGVAIGGLLVCGFGIWLLGENQINNLTNPNAGTYDGPEQIGMGYKDSQGTWTRVTSLVPDHKDPTKMVQLTPAYCLPKGQQKNLALMFDFAKAIENGYLLPKVCYRGGIPLVPNTPDDFVEATRLEDAANAARDFLQITRGELEERNAEEAAEEAAEQAEIQAAHNRRVELLQARNPALRPLEEAPDHQVVQGIDHLAGKNAGLYDFLIGEPNVLNARAITLEPHQYFDAALDPNRPTPRCTGVYPKRAGLGFTEVPGADRVSNKGNAVITVVTYEYPIGSKDPFGNKCG